MLLSRRHTKIVAPGPVAALSKSKKLLKNPRIGMRKTQLFLLYCIAALLFAFSGSVSAQLSDVTQPGDPIIPSSPNSPGSEGVANAIDNQPTKYLNFDSGRWHERWI